MHLELLSCGMIALKVRGVCIPFLGPLLPRDVMVLLGTHLFASKI